MITGLYAARGKLIVKSTEKKNQTESGLYIPDTADEPVLEAEVLSVGYNRYEFGHEVPNDIKVGYVVLYAKFVGNEITIEGEKLRIINQADVIAIKRYTESENE